MPIAARPAMPCPACVEALEMRSIRKAHPFLGICVGMQLMSSRGPRKDRDRGPRLDQGDVVKDDAD
jgi:glutamine amidotransferase